MSEQTEWQGPTANEVQAAIDQMKGLLPQVSEIRREAERTSISSPWRTWRVLRNLSGKRNDIRDPVDDCLDSYSQIIVAISRNSTTMGQAVSNASLLTVLDHHVNRLQSAWVEMNSTIEQKASQSLAVVALGVSLIALTITILSNIYDLVPVIQNLCSL